MNTLAQAKIIVSQWPKRHIRPPLFDSPEAARVWADKNERACLQVLDNRLADYAAGRCQIEAVAHALQAWLMAIDFYFASLPKP